MNLGDRRNIAARHTSGARWFAARLAAWGISPNRISVFSVVFALLGAWGIQGNTAWGWWMGAAGIQLRLLCNLLDGMVAVEHRRTSSLGVLYNEFPDRIADSVLLVAFGCSVTQVGLGWLAALLASLTAYVRVFGGSLGLPQSFRGPMAKQHRMAILTVACVVLGMWPASEYSQARITVELGVLGLLVAGSALTCVFRTMDIARALLDRDARLQAAVDK
jgi:phosphatidylglycerophosphate synthase